MSDTDHDNAEPLDQSTPAVETSVVEATAPEATSAAQEMAAENTATPEQGA